ncbi:MAG: tetratricopeptide repeat protein [bacterium]|nr:MAG: tetratricopeptide repeat protein [bacterium]
MRSVTIYLGLSLLLVTSLCHPLWALEVSELTVDFPLADVFSIQQDTLGDSGGEGQQPGLSASWKAAWEDDWFAYRQRVVRGDLAGAKKSLDRINQYRLTNGIPNLYLPAAALLMEASVAREQSRYKDALDIIDAAEELAPDDPAPHFLRARTRWSQNQLRALGSLDAFFQGCIAFAKDFRSIFPWSLGLALWIFFGTLAASVITILLVAVQVYPRLCHDLSHFIKLPNWAWNLVMAAALGILLIVGMPFMVWIILIALVMAMHLNSRERVLIALAVFLMICLPLIMQVLTISDGFYSGNTGLTLFSAERGGEGARVLDELHSLRVRDQSDPRVLSTFALVLKRSGRTREAESLLREAMEISPESPRIINNLANILFATGRVEQAIDHFRRALRYSDDPIIHYNLSQALRENLQLEEGEREFLIAQEKVPDLTGSLASERAEGGRRITVDLFGSLTEYLSSGLRIDEAGKAWRENLWDGIVPKVPYRFGWLIFPVSSLLLVAVWPMGDKISTAERCRQCNRLHCSKCSEASQEVLCAQCRHIFHIRTGIDPTSRVKKMMHIMRFKKRRALLTRLATLMLPGTGHVLLNSGWRSLIMIALTMFFWAKWVLWHGLLRNTTMLEIQAGSGAKIWFFVLFGAYYLFVLRSVGKRLEEV